MALKKPRNLEQPENELVGFGFECPSRDLHIQDQYWPMILRNTDMSFVRNMRVDNNHRGILFRNVDMAGGGGLQSNLQSVLSQTNDDAGFRVEAIGSQNPQITLGDWINGCATFANKTFGVALLGKASGQFMVSGHRDSLLVRMEQRHLSRHPR